MAKKLILHGKWSEKGVPHKDWECVSIEDLETPSAICEMCGIQEIRYVHYMRHYKYPDVLAVGCVCAGKMEENRLRAEIRERALRSAGSRRKRWPDLKSWSRSENGNSTISKDGWRVTVFQKEISWSGVIIEEKTRNKTFAQKKYQSERKAKLAAFDGITYLEPHS